MGVGANVAVARRRILSVVVVLASLALLHVPTAGAERPPTIPYLALGDSLPYGWDVVTQPVTVDPSAHVGYPEVLATRSPLEVTNASCPGETSSSFLSAAAPATCAAARQIAGIKVDWGDGTQLAFAADFLAANPDTGLVSIQLGANDLFQCQATPGGCDPAEFAGVLQTIATNLTTTIVTLRSTGYTGPIVLVAYYALDYTDPNQVFVAQVSRDAVLQPLADAFDGVVVADGFAAFERASRRSGGDPCAAGLLLRRPDGCDIHTTPTGDRVLAQAVRRAIDLGAIVDDGALGSRARAPA